MKDLNFNLIDTRDELSYMIGYQKDKVFDLKKIHKMFTLSDRIDYIKLIPIRRTAYLNITNTKYE